MISFLNMNVEKEKLETFGWGALYGTLLGFSLTTGLFLIFPQKSSDVISLFRREDKPAVIRHYRDSARDGVYVQDSVNTNKFVTLENYLDVNYTNKYGRAIEEAEIRKLINW